jgi:4-alpha-glucanotransferase
MGFSRSSGVLLHISSLPGPHGSGDFGPAAYHFVDWLCTAGQGLWQVLPLGGIGAGHSPYMSSSAFAGNVLFIDLAELAEHGWLDPKDLEPSASFTPDRVPFAEVIAYRTERLEAAARRFAAGAKSADREDFEAFCDTHSGWLPDYALFMALAEHFEGQNWTAWDSGLARRRPEALAAARETHRARIFFWTFCQWSFFRQWRRLKAYANARAVQIIGDLPIFIAHQSAEVWAHPELFELDGTGKPTVVAGVPPDAFSATGQRWGNPLYRWSAHAADGYAWWIERMRRIVEMVDIVRIDHFRGFEAYWEIPAEEATAERGRWVPAPGDDLFAAVTRVLGPLPVIAEDLGVITAEVEALRRKHGFPGMRILQFAFGEFDADRRFLPHNFEPDTVVFPGTHDNDTALGWWHHAPPHVRAHLRAYLATDASEIGWDLIRAACASVAATAIYPLQDILGLGSLDRMNLPGTAVGNWSWRFTWDEVLPEHARRLAALCRLYERGPHRP